MTRPRTTKEIDITIERTTHTKEDHMMVETKTGEEMEMTVGDITK